MQDGELPRYVDKPWGGELWFAHTDRYAGKLLHVKAGERLSVQYHAAKDESSLLLCGRLLLRRGPSAESLVETERVLASVIEAVIGACYLNCGYETTAAAVVEAFQPEIEQALMNPVDFKSTLQERLAQRGEVVAYDVSAEHGPPHDRTFQVLASVGGRPVGAGSGRSKKHAEQEAARAALDMLDSALEDDEDEEEEDA